MILYSTATTCPNSTTNLRLTGQNVAAKRFFFFWIPCLQSLMLATIFELSLIFRILPRCRGREKILSLKCVLWKDLQDFRHQRTTSGHQKQWPAVYSTSAVFQMVALKVAQVPSIATHRLSLKQYII